MQITHSTIIILVDKIVVVSKSREIKFARLLTEVIYERLEKGTDGLEDCRCMLANLHYVKTHSHCLME